jgi:type III restriction enzyme
VYILRNAGLFKIYRFSDGKAMEPDFVLFLKKENLDEIEQYQLFIEAKGKHLIKTDQWKEDFLKEIEEKYQIKIEPRLFGEDEKYKLIGFPFYNEWRKSQFIEVLKEKLGLT